MDWEPSRSRGTRAQVQLALWPVCRGDWSEVDNPCVGLRKRNAPARTMGRATGAML